jgi:hypothetical protein
MSKAGLPAFQNDAAREDAGRARNALTRSLTPSSNEVACLFRSGTHDLAGQRRAVPSKRSRSYRCVITAIALAIDFPDISRALSKFIVAFVILYDEQTPQPVRAALSEGMQS